MRARLVLLAGALAAFCASLAAGFHFDDYAIFSDPVLGSASGWMQVWGPRQTRPLTYLTFWLNYEAEFAGLFAIATALILALIFPYQGRRLGLRDLYDMLRDTGL